MKCFVSSDGFKEESELKARQADYVRRMAAAGADTLKPGSIELMDLHRKIVADMAEEETRGLKVHRL